MTSAVTSGFSNLAPPWNLTLTLPTEAPQLMLLTSGRPVLSLLMPRVSATESPFTFRSKEPLFLLSEQRKHHCRRHLAKGLGLQDTKGRSYLHPSEVFDPPVSTQVDEGSIYGEFNSTSSHQLNRSNWQPNVHYLYAKKIYVCQGNRQFTN